MYICDEYQCSVLTLEIYVYFLRLSKLIDRVYEF